MANALVKTDNIVFNWIISQLDCKPNIDGFQDYVVVCHWRYGATYENLYTDIYGACPFTVDPENPDFTPYAELTEDQVIGWLESSLDVLSMQEQLAKSIEELINPPIISPPLPWSVPPENNVPA